MDSFSLGNVVFACSALLLLVSLAAEIWAHAIHLNFLDSLPIACIEQRHKRLPSVRFVLGIIFSTLLLFPVTLRLTSSMPLFASPERWAYLATLFTNVCALGIMAAVRKLGSASDAFAFSTGSSLAFLSIVIIRIIQRDILQALMLIGLLAICISLWWVMGPHMRFRRVQTIIVATIIIWFALMFL